MRVSSQVQPIATPFSRPLTAPGAGGNPLANVAPVVILLGQSLNASRGTKVLTSTWADAYMPVDGVAVQDWTFFGTNQDLWGNYASLASVSALAEGVNQSPCVGVSTMLEGVVPRAYITAIAVGARDMATIIARGQRYNLYGALKRLCEIAVADGYEPRPVFYSAHGEANAASATSENTYYDQAIAFYRSAQLAAAQAIGDPSYVAPVVLTYPVQTNAGDSGARDIAIKTAIKRVGDDLPGAVMLGPVYQWPCESDRVHPTPASYVLRGEAVGRTITRKLQGITDEALHITGVTLSGSTFVATFSHPVVRDSTLNVGSNLNTSFARDGFEWLDNGGFIQITDLIYSGNTVTGTLASTPAGTLAQQRLRIASQATTATLTPGAQNLAGSLVRKDAAGWASDFDPAYTNYEWASPQVCTVEAA